MQTAAPTGTAVRCETPNQAYKLPPIRRFLIKNGHVRIDDAVRKLHFTGTVTSQENRGGEGGRPSP